MSITASTNEITVHACSETQHLRTKVGAVVIGRNEGERLFKCLQSLVNLLDKVVYVDSGSTDGSCELAESLGVDILQLDLSIPFTAARARNEGFQKLLERHPDIAFVQVVDGDCIIADNWLMKASDTIEADPGLAIVCGQRREIHPNATPYNNLCDMEWSGEAGDIEACGGDAIIRVEAFQQAGGYNPTFIAGEEPEMCVRLRANGWRIHRTSDDMTWHDAAMTRFPQWWKRARRAGHAYAEGYATHGSTTAFRRREVRSILFWGGAVPVLAIAAAVPTFGISLVIGLLGYVRMYVKIRRHRIARGNSPDAASLYARFTLLGKFPQLMGILQYYKNRIFRTNSKLIEYK